MKKSFIALGFALIFVGLISVSLLDHSTISRQTDNKKSVTKKWTIDWNFLPGEIMGIHAYQPYDWSVPAVVSLEPMEIPPGSGQTFQEVKILEINITNPRGNHTIIEIYYIILEPGQGALPFSEYFGVPENNGGLILDGDYPYAEVISGIGVVQLGKTPYEGVYNVTCSMYPEMVMDQEIIDENPDGTPILRPWPHKVSPPDKLELYKTREEILYPYRSLLLPLGVSTITVGSIMTISGVVQRKKPIRHQREAKSVKSA